MVFALAAFTAADAAGRHGQNERSGGSLDRILPQIRHTMPGTFYDAEGPFLTPDGQATYRIKWMTPDGRLVWFSVDARSGQILGGARGGNSYSRDPYRRDDERSNFGDSRDDRGGRDDRGDSARNPSRGGDDRYDRGRDQERNDHRGQNRGPDRNPGRDRDQDRGRGRSPR